MRCTFAHTNNWIGSYSKEDQLILGAPPAPCILVVFSLFVVLCVVFVVPLL